jgi:dienelactone hydrolase
LVAIGLGVNVVACSSSGGPGPFARPGPFVAGVATVSLPYTKVELWYPADPASARGRTRSTYDLRDWLPAALAARVTPGDFTFTTDAYRGVPVAQSGPFPLVLFAHGLNSFRDQSTFLTTWLASWGFIVAAPDFPTHDLTEFFADLGRPAPTTPTDEQVLADTEALVRQLNVEPGSPIRGQVKPGKVGIVGHSQGGIDAMAFSSRPEIATYIPLAAGFVGTHPPLPAKPSLYMVGSEDHDILPQWVRDVYDTAPQPKRLVVLAKAGHLAFTDLCLVGAAHGGLRALGAQIGLQLPAGSPFTPSATDGCAPTNLSPQAGFAVVRQAVVAQLRHSLSA